MPWNGKLATARNGKRAALAVASGGLLVWLLTSGGFERLAIWGERFGGYFVIVLLLLGYIYVLGDKYLPPFIAAQKEIAVASHRLADSVQTLTERDQAWQREQEVLLNHVARTQDELRQDFQGLRETIGTHLERSVKFAGQYEHRLDRLEKRFRARKA